MNTTPSLLRRKKWQPRCYYCNRRIFDTDFIRGLAQYEEEWFGTFNGPDCRELYAHTYDCESEKRRRIK